MGGNGPAPKDPSRRARRNGDPVPQTVLTFVKSEQPDLPDSMPEGEPWPPETIRWWNLWGDSAQAELMTVTDWSFLQDTAVLHANLWLGQTSVAAELRLRVAKFGATLEDRARLRIVFATADEADGGQVTKSPAQQEAAARYGKLRTGGAGHLQAVPALPAGGEPEPEDHGTDAVAGT